MQIDSVKKYLTSGETDSAKTPYFLFINDENYKPVLSELMVLGLDLVPISNFCGDDDKIPDIDGLLNHIEIADVNAFGKQFVITGLGEFLSLMGADEATHTLSRLKDIYIGNAKVVLFLRGLNSLIAGLEADPRFDARRHCVVDKAECDLSFTLVASSVGLSGMSNFKAMLAELENGRTGRIVVNTAVDLGKSLFTVQKINSAHEGIKFFSKGDFTLAQSLGTEEFWAILLSELNQSNGLLNEVFENHGFNDNPGSDFYIRAAGSDYDKWLYFIFLKSKVDKLRNSYLRFVLAKTSCFENFVINVRDAIIDIPHTEKQFGSFYQERKTLVEKFPESEIASFVANNRKDVTESIYKLTDGTNVEREEIIAWLSKNKLTQQLELQIESIYPVLAVYLKKYVFNSSELADLLSDYFEEYKRQKLSNQLDPKFLEKIEELAKFRKFNCLPTRDEIVDGVEKNGTYLYWLDALGVEYLSLIEALAKKRGLSIRVNIARAELPTITSINRGFFDAWQEKDREKNGDLDDIKHKDAGGYNFTNTERPIHLAKELSIIVTMIDKAATKLASGGNCKRFLIASDHGASRLAVLRRKEEMYETDTKGEHSGRCCELFRPYVLPFAAEENGYIVLADYGRFKGSRAANVEVHGGASLEEVVVPVIELTLKDGSITVELVNEAVTVDFRTGTEITLFFNVPVQNVSIVLNGKSYHAVLIDDHHYSVKLPDMKRAGDYRADVRAGDDLIGTVVIKAQGKSGKVNDAFDDMF